MQRIFIDPTNEQPPTRDLPRTVVLPDILPPSKDTKHHPTDSGNENGTVFFVGAATVILEWAGIRILTDPNFLHAGDRAQFGAGVSSERRTNPAVELHDLPRIDLILLSHCHGDHFDQKVKTSLRRDIPIVTSPHARVQLTNQEHESFTNVSALAPFETGLVEIGGTGGPKRPLLRITGLPGKHVPSTAVAGLLNKMANAIPPTTGWILELGTSADTHDPTEFTPGYRIYITGDTLMTEALDTIHERYTAQDKPIDLMLAHLGGTMIPSPTLSPLGFMVSMDAAQGVRLMRMIEPDVTIPIHYDDYEIFASGLEEFTKEVAKSGLEGRVVVLERRESYRFRVRGEVWRARSEEAYFGGGNSP
ncbi:hypothetical protein PEBR_19091 [Penicillium brasilianum]|uniref:Metallo-beta-lactamase domain-containing protein n=1 Tax=Penicillium brasilianum TaxID=104259 RepID=A0A1S9RND9_PENBI|nr:hypothetical protein PEBR_19091 [Penicillium brasilianum]